MLTMLFQTHPSRTDLALVIPVIVLIIRIGNRNSGGCNAGRLICRIYIYRWRAIVNKFKKINYMLILLVKIFF